MEVNGTSLKVVGLQDEMSLQQQCPGYSGSSTDPTVNGFHWSEETAHVEIVILGKAQVLQITLTVALFYPRVKMSYNSVFPFASIVLTGHVIE